MALYNKHLSPTLKTNLLGIPFADAIEYRSSDAKYAIYSLMRLSVCHIEPEDTAFYAMLPNLFGLLTASFGDRRKIIPMDYLDYQNVDLSDAYKQRPQNNPDESIAMKIFNKVYSTVDSATSGLELRAAQLGNLFTPLADDIVPIESADGMDALRHYTGVSMSTVDLIQPSGRSLGG